MRAPHLLQPLSRITAAERQQSLLKQLDDFLDHLKEAPVLQLERVLDRLHGVQVLADDIDVGL